MKFMPIPPATSLSYFTDTADIFALYHLCKMPGYTEALWNAREKDPDKFILLDNSAYELGTSVGLESLIGYANHISASEIVLPDALRDSEGTIAMTTMALQWFRERYYDSKGKAYMPKSYMLVPQGTNKSEWLGCLKILLNEYGFHCRRIGSGMPRLTIGIPKVADHFPGGRLTLLEELAKIQGSAEWPEYEFQAHLLGWTDASSVQEAAGMHYSWLRSIDSAKPFRYALNNHLLQVEAIPPDAYFKGDDSYHQIDMDYSIRKIASWNALVFGFWAKDHVRGI